MSNCVLGIDFGTSFSSVAVLFNREIMVVHDEIGSTFIPSVVCFREKEKVGATAEHFKKKYPKNTIYEIKRIVGCRYDDAIVSRMQKIWPFSVVEGMEHRVQVEFYVNDKRRRYYPEYVISKILKYLVELAENVTGEKYKKAVITVPANFNDTQRKCIRVAARFANLEVLRIMDEPVAAAVAISIQTNIDNSRVLVYDLGGGTFDFTILEVTINDFRVLATDGDPCLGGADFTNALMGIAQRKILLDEKIDSNEFPRLEVELRNTCEVIKQELTSLEQTQMELDLSRYGGSPDYKLVINRAEFENAIKDQVNRSVDIVENCMNTYNVHITSVSGIALVGGSSCIPLIRKELSKRFPTLRFLDGYDSREVVCRGALVQALSLIDAPDPLPTHQTSSQPSTSSPPMSPSQIPSVSKSLPVPPPIPQLVPQGVSAISSSSISSKSTADLPKLDRGGVDHPSLVRPSESLKPEYVEEPSRQSSSSSNTPVSVSPSLVQPSTQVVFPQPISIVDPNQSTPNSSLKPEESSSIMRSFGQVKIHPTTPLDLGIRVRGKYMSVIIPRNTPLPTSQTKTYQTNEDHPDCVRCVIYQGNDDLVANNVKIGIIKAKDIPVYENVRSLITVTFMIDINGVFSVSAKVVGSDLPVTVEMLDSVLLTDNMIDSIIAEDNREKEEIIQVMRGDLISEIDLRLQEMENSDDYRTIALVAREQEWLEKNKDSATVDDLQKCLDRLK